MQPCPISRSLLALACAWVLGSGSAGAVALCGTSLEGAPGAALHATTASVLWAALSPEQREQMRSQIREHREQMSAEERQQRREKMRERRESLSPEERQLLRERIREHRRQLEEQHLEVR